MKVSTKRRLERLEGQLADDTQRVVVIQRVGESRDDADANLERWKAGEEVGGIRCSEPYRGGDISVVYVIYVEPAR
jgi:hypothetical protein